MSNNIDLNIYENGSLPTLDIGKSIDQMPEDQKMGFLDLCYKKLAYGGKLKLQGVHLDSFCKEYLFSQKVNLAAILQLQSITPINDIQTKLQQYNMNITYINTIDGIYTIEAVK